MGALVGGLIGGLGSYFGAQQQASAAKDASQAALTGYNYLNNSSANNQYINNGASANSSISQLLGQSPITDATKNGFSNYLNSTGYNFNLQQGTNAIASQGAASGLLNSGGTGKAYEEYGQNLGSQYFNNYLGQLSGLSGQGQNSLFATGQAGSAGGGASAQALTNMGDAQASGTNSLFGAAQGVFTSPSVIGTAASGTPGTSGYAAPTSGYLGNWF